MKIHYFQRYHQGEDRATSNTMLMLSRLQKTKGAFWGVGAGENRSGLHTAEYEFNDAIIGTVIDLYAKLMTLPYLHFPYHAETHSQ